MSDLTMSMFLRKEDCAEARADTAVTEAMVEAACKGYWPSHWPGNFDKNDVGCIRSHMRAALEAALKESTQ